MNLNPFCAPRAGAIDPNLVCSIGPLDYSFIQTAVYVIALLAVIAAAFWVLRTYK
jgi:hypothetical protein